MQGWDDLPCNCTLGFESETLQDVVWTLMKLQEAAKLPFMLKVAEPTPNNQVYIVLSFV